MQGIYPSLTDNRFQNSASNKVFLDFGAFVHLFCALGIYGINDSIGLTPLLTVSSGHLPVKEGEDALEAFFIIDCILGLS